MNENEIGKIVIDSAYKIHKNIGPGLLESVYEIVLSYELEKSGLMVKRQEPVSIEYEGIRFKEGFRADIIIEDKVIIEIKSVEALNNAHKKQLLTYLRLTGLRLGYLINFSGALLKNGISRIINGEIE